MKSPELSAESQRRQATVLFADISGFTAMSEKLDPEHVREVMNSCFALLERVAIAHGGRVDKYIGDCVMVLFGVPTAIENAPKQAVNAAIRMRDALEQFNGEHNLPVRLQIHTGVNSGLVIAGDVGGQVKRDFTVMGDTVNVASRLKDTCADGQIYVGADTYLYTKAEFEYHELKLALKGKKEPVLAYELRSAKPKIHRAKIAAAPRAISSVMIGREQELGQLRNWIIDVFRGTGAIVSITGEAGLGKSRLLAEVGRLHEIEGVLLLEGRSLFVGRSLSFHPFVDLLRHWAGITDEDDERGALAKLEAAVARVAADTAGEILPFVATLMGMRLSGAYAGRIKGIEGEALEKMILKSTRDLLRNVAGIEPLVLVFEDLHWADLSSIKLLESLLRLARDSRILFIHLFRPDYPETAGRVLRYVRGEHADQHLEIELQPLNTAECEQLVCNLLDMSDLPRATRALIAGRAEGNPFYIEEVVRSLVDQGAVKDLQGRLSVTDKIHEVVIPGTIQEVVMGRVDRLDKATRRVLEVASVMGRRCRHRIIAKVMEGDTNLEAKLAHLIERQLLRVGRSRRTASPRRVTLAEELEYTFQHALVQETIYESILQKTRKELHVTVARSIESIFLDRLPDFYGMLAYHYTRAESLEKAEEYLFKAGDEAARSAASSEALTFFKEASRYYFKLHGNGGDPKKKELLEKNIGMALLNTGQLTECIPHFDKALEHLGERVPKSAAALHSRFVLDLLAVLFNLYVRGPRRLRSGCDSDREFCQIINARARASVTSDPKRFVFDNIGGVRRMNRIEPRAFEKACGLYAVAGGIFSFSGMSFALSRRFLDLAKQCAVPGNVSDEFDCRHLEFTINYLEGYWDRNDLIDEVLVEEALRHGHFWDVSTYVGLLAEKHIDQGNFAAVPKQVAKCAELVETYGFDFARSNELALTAYLLLEQRRLDAALVAVEQYYTERPEGLLNLLALGTKAKIQILLGNYAAAENTLQAADALALRLGQIPPFHQRPYRLARLHLATTELERACSAGDRRAIHAAAGRTKKAGREAVKVSRKLGRMRTEAFRLVGLYYWLVGRRKWAARCWLQSIQEGERLQAKPELARTYMEVGRRMAGPPQLVGNMRATDAAACLQKGRALLSEMGLEWDLEHLDVVRPDAFRLGYSSVA